MYIFFDKLYVHFFIKGNIEFYFIFNFYNKTRDKATKANVTNVKFVGDPTFFSTKLKDTTLVFLLVKVFNKVKFNFLFFYHQI